MLTNPQSILITGASSGIGEALARHYAQPGITLFLGGRDPQRLQAVSEHCQAQGARVEYWVGDVNDEEATRNWILNSDQQRPLNLVIANAGVALGAGEVEDLHGVAAKTFAINVNGVFNTVHPALEVMAQRKPYPVENAQVAIMSSIMGYAGLARSPAYCASKAAVKSYGEALRGTFRAMGIGITVICPGYVASRITDKSASTLPFLIPADQAAASIAHGLARNKARITFPWQVMIIARICMNLPAFISDRLNRPWGVPRLEDNE